MEGRGAVNWSTSFLLVKSLADDFFVELVMDGSAIYKLFISLFLITQKNGPPMHSTSGLLLINVSKEALGFGTKSKLLKLSRQCIQTRPVRDLSLHNVHRRLRKISKLWKDLVALPGLEPGLFALRGRRVNQLHHNARTA